MYKLIFQCLSCYLLSIPLAVTGCVETPMNYELMPTTWTPSNSSLLKQPIDLKNCLDKNQNIVSKNSTIEGLGIILHPNPFSIRTQAWEQLLKDNSTPSKPTFAPTAVGMSVIPYIINNDNNKIMLVPRLPIADFNKFLPACEPGFEGLGEIFFRMPYFYPTVILKVAEKQKNKVVDSLTEQLKKDCQFGEFTEKPVTPIEVTHNKPLSMLLKEVFNDQQAVFLQTLPEAQEVILSEAKVQFTIKHDVKNHTVGPPLPEDVPEPRTVEIKLVWPKILGKLIISGCQEANISGQDYASSCSFTAGKTYHIKRAPQPENLIQIRLTWPEELGQLIIPTCQKPTEIEEGYSSTCSFSTGNSYRIVPPMDYPDDTRRKLIVVSLSAHFNSEGTGELLQNGLYNGFNKLKNSNQPFTLLTIGSGRQLSNPILESEELPNLIMSNNSDALKEKMRQLQFSANDLNALDDLELIDAYMTSQPVEIGQILYFTDNMGMLEHPPRKQLGIPLVWRREGIKLTVLTTKTCQFWEERADARCTEWRDKKPETLEQTLKAFFSVSSTNQ